MELFFSWLSLGNWSECVGGEGEWGERGGGRARPCTCSSSPSPPLPFPQEKDPQAFYFSKNVSAMFDNHKIMLF